MNPSIDDLSFVIDSIRGDVNYGFINAGNTKASFVFRCRLTGNIYLIKGAQLSLFGNYSQMAAPQYVRDQDVQPDLLKSAMVLRWDDIGIPDEFLRKIVDLNRKINELCVQNLGQNKTFIRLPVRSEKFAFRNQVICPKWKGPLLIQVRFLNIDFGFT